MINRPLTSRIAPDQAGRLALAGALDADERARLLEIADKCPIHRTLTSEVDIRTKLEAS